MGGGVAGRLSGAERRQRFPVVARWVEGGWLIIEWALVWWRVGAHQDCVAYSPSAIRVEPWPEGLMSGEIKWMNSRLSILGEK